MSPEMAHQPRRLQFFEDATLQKQHYHIS